MTSQADILEKIRLFSENVQKNEKQRMDDGSDTVDYRAYNKRLDGALEELRDQVGRQEAVLNEVCPAQRLLFLIASRPFSSELAPPFETNRTSTAWN